MSNYRNDPFWFDKVSILYAQDRFTEFFPGTDMNLHEKMNALVRFSFYFGVTMAVIYKEANYLGIPICAMIISYIIYRGGESNKPDIKEQFYSVRNKECQKPTKENPYMNFLVTDKRDRKAACPTYKNKKLEEEVSGIVNKDLYMSTDEVWQRKNTERQFYTMPNTRSMNDQKAFAEWCFGQPDTCKEGNGVQCAANIYNDLSGADLQSGHGPGLASGASG